MPCRSGRNRWWRRTGDLLSEVLRLGLERLNQEIKRRSRVVRIFPNPQSCRRLAAARLKEHHEDWITGRRYIDMSRRQEQNVGPPEEATDVSPAA